MRENGLISMDRAGCFGRIREQIEGAEAILVGAGAGLSASAGLTYEGERFLKYFGDFIKKYGMRDMYSAGFYPFETQEEKWAYWSRHIYYNRYAAGAGEVYLDLYDILKNKNYFVLTTNVDHQFWMAGFENERIFATQGDYGLFQCAGPCHSKLYDNESQVMAMLEQQKNCRIPAKLTPRCPVCGGNMEVNLRCDDRFVEDEAWSRAAERYHAFLQENAEKRILLLELGVGMNTPGIVKYPFFRMTKEWDTAFYICVNKGQAWTPAEIEDKSLCVNSDIREALRAVRREQEIIKGDAAEGRRSCG